MQAYFCRCVTNNDFSFACDALKIATLSRRPTQSTRRCADPYLWVRVTLDRWPIVKHCIFKIFGLNEILDKDNQNEFTFAWCLRSLLRTVKEFGNPAGAQSLCFFTLKEPVKMVQTSDKQTTQKTGRRSYGEWHLDYHIRLPLQFRPFSIQMLCYNSDTCGSKNRILLNALIDHNVTSNGRVVLWCFQLDDSCRKWSVMLC